MRQTRARVLLAATLSLTVSLGAACGGEPPRIDDVQPRMVAKGEAVELVVRGAGFHWKYDSLSNTVSGSFQIRVGEVALADVRWVDANELRGTLGPEVDVGRHAITVDGPTGSATRNEALYVRPPEEDDAP